MTDEDRWRSSEPPASGPSAPSDLRFSPWGTGIGVFAAIAIPFVVVDYSRTGGGGGTLIVLGILVGVIAGGVVGLWVSHRDGYIWRGRRM